MLFRNDQRYELTADDFKVMSDFIGCSHKGARFLEFPKGGVVVKPPRSLYVVDKENNNKVYKPGMAIISFEEEVEATEGTVKWNYCKRPPVVKQGESPRYYEGTDGALMMSHRFTVNENQPDYLFFLICISRVGAHNPNCKRALFEIENKKREAKENINKRMQKVEVEAHILHPVTKLHDKDISRIAQAMKVPNIDGLDDDEIRSALLNKIEAMEASIYKNGYKMFLEFTDTNSPVGSRTDLLAGIQRLKDLKVIKFQGQSNKWISLNSEGKKTGIICALYPGKDPDESLEHHVVSDEEVGEMIAKLIKDSAGIKDAFKEEN